MKPVIHRAAGRIGAHVDGIELAHRLDEETVGLIRAALVTHKVLFFEGQHLTHAQHIAFARRFGIPTRRPHPQGDDGPGEYPEIFTFDPRIDLEHLGRDYEAHFRARWAMCQSGWHTDVSHAVNPPMGSILRPSTLPSRGGDTSWTNLVAAYEGLSGPLRDALDGMRAEHTFWAGYRMADHDPDDREIREVVDRNQRAAVHPVVRVHPETGERALFVNPSRTRHLVGLSPAENRHLLDLLFAHLTRPEYTVRLSWRPGAVAFWDNRATAHIAATDFVHTGEARTMHRVTLAGDRPVGPDGFVSEALVGDPLP